VKVPSLIPVKSSQIEGVGFGAAGLFIRFSGGGLYQYPDAPKHVFDELVQAESVGKAFHAKVKGRYTHVKHDA
jgi:KTSC domain-containing protein